MFWYRKDKKNFWIIQYLLIFKYDRKYTNDKRGNAGGSTKTWLWLSYG